MFGIGLFSKSYLPKMVSALSAENFSQLSSQLHHWDANLYSDAANRSNFTKCTTKEFSKDTLCCNRQVATASTIQQTVRCRLDGQRVLYTWAHCFWILRGHLTKLREEQTGWVPSVETPRSGQDSPSRCNGLVEWFILARIRSGIRKSDLIRIPPEFILLYLQ